MKFAAYKSNSEILGKNDRSTAMSSRSVGILKYIMKDYAPALAHLDDFVRIMDAYRNFDTVDYVIAMGLLGEIHRAESRYPQAKQRLTVAKQILEKNETIAAKLEGMSEMVSLRIEAVSRAPQEKSFFSRLTELARFEDEVSGEKTIEEKYQEMLQTFVFLDD
jgi:uncharacterized membrane-anchored protein